MLPLISILIPCYNREKYVYRCLLSCLNQTYSNIEIIVIDDGSKDNSLQNLKEMQRRSEKIKIYSQKNLGVAETRNKLVSYAKGVYIFFVDIDDIVPRNAIEKLYDASNNSDMNLIAGRTIALISWLQFLFFPTMRRTRNMTAGHFVKSNVCPPWGVLIKTSYFHKLNVKFMPNEVFEDIGVMPYLYLESKGKFKMIPHVVYKYQISHYLNRTKDKITNFNGNSQMKIYSICKQYLWLMKYLERNKWNENKEYRRYINGVLYQISVAVVFLSNNLRVPHSIFQPNTFKLVSRYNLISLYREFGYNRVKFSKTFWKTLSFFFLNLWYRDIYKYFDKDVEHNFMDFINNYVIKNERIFYLKHFSEYNQKKNKRNIIVGIKFHEIEQFIEKCSNNLEQFPRNSILLIEFKNIRELKFFIKKYYFYLNTHNFLLGASFAKKLDWNLVAKYFSFVYSDNIETLRDIQKEMIKTIVMSSTSNDKTLVNYKVNIDKENDIKNQ